MFTYTMNKNISVLLTWITSSMLCQPTQREFCVIFFFTISRLMAMMGRLSIEHRA